MECLKAANQGQVKSQNNVGIMYEKRQGVRLDYGVDLEWYLKAANQGNMDAQRNIGLLCIKKGMEWDDIIMEKEWEKTITEP